MRQPKVFVVGFMAAAVLLAGTGAAVAGVSDGNYSYDRQHCSGYAEDVERSSTTEPGCQNFATEVNDGNGNEIVRVGLPQLADGEHPDPTRATYSVTPDGFDPTTGVHYYTGADDNLDNGEHDGTDQVHDGPSDGGSIVLNIDPNAGAAWVTAVQAGDAQYLATHPVPFVDFGVGMCTDGLCWSLQTQRRTAFDGGNTTTPARDAANYDGHTWDPETCSSADPNVDTCSDSTGSHDLAYWYGQNGPVYVEPGFQVYEDPSPNGSPLEATPYPIPALYVGTCGVVAGGGPVQAPASPVTNGAGQLVVTTTC